MSDPWSAFLTDRRAAHKQVADRAAETGWVSADDAWDELGPMGLAQWSAGRSSREALALIAFAERMVALADCLSEQGSGPLVDRGFVARRIREALTALTNAPKENEHG